MPGHPLWLPPELGDLLAVSAQTTQAVWPILKRPVQVSVSIGTLHLVIRKVGVWIAICHIKNCEFVILGQGFQPLSVPEVMHPRSWSGTSLLPWLRRARVNHSPGECVVLRSPSEKPIQLGQGADMSVGKGGHVHVVMAARSRSFSVTAHYFFSSNSPPSGNLGYGVTDGDLAKMFEPEAATPDLPLCHRSILPGNFRS